MTNLSALSVGTRLAEDYRIERILGAGGFGITYLAEETPLARLVTIKEYFPVDFAVRDTNNAAQPRSGDCTGDYQWGLDRFLDEARTLARFDHPNIVRVYRFFRENNSGFMVLHYEDGKSFKAWLKSLGRAPRQHELDRVVPPLLDALALIHASDFLHRDIAPDNIIIRNDGSPVLIDFGSARGDIAQHSRTVSALVKPGYSPYEQYATTGRQQGPWTDIYSLAATLYQAVTGKRPPDSPSRMVEDELVPARDAAISAYRPGFLAAIDAALALDVGARPRSVDDWRKQLLAPAPTPKATLAAEPFVAERASEPPSVGKPAPAGGGTGGTFKSKLGPKAKARPPVDADAVVIDIASAASKAAPKKKAERKPALSADIDVLSEPPHKPISEGRVAAIFREWRARRAADRPAPAPHSRIADAAAVEPTPQPAAAPAVAIAPAPAPAVAVETPPKANLPVLAPRRAPRPARAKRKWWRSPLLAKGLIGLCVAGFAVAIQDSLPRVGREGSGKVTSGVPAGAQVGQIVGGHKGGVDTVRHTPDGRHIVTTGQDGTLKVWQTGTNTLVRTLQLGAGPATSIAVADTRVVTGHKAGRIELWDVALGGHLVEIHRNDADIWSVAFAGSPDRILAAGHDWKVALLNARTPKLPIHVFEGHESAVQAVAFSAARNLIATGSADRTVRTWSAETFEAEQTIRGHQDYLTALAFSPDGSVLASGDLSGAVRVSSIAGRRTVRSMKAHKGGVTALVYSADGNWLATAGRDGDVKIWDMVGSRAPQVFAGHAGEVRSLSFATDGLTLASAGADGVVRFWSTAFMARSGS